MDPQRKTTNIVVADCTPAQLRSQVNFQILSKDVKKESIQNAIQLLKESGIQIDILSTEGSAFANLFENWSQAVSPSIPPLPQVVDAEGLEPSTPLRHINLVLNIGHSQSLLAVFENNI